MQGIDEERGFGSVASAVTQDHETARTFEMGEYVRYANQRSLRRERVELRRRRGGQHTCGSDMYPVWAEDFARLGLDSNSPRSGVLRSNQESALSSSHLDQRVGSPSATPGYEAAANAAYLSKDRRTHDLPLLLTRPKYVTQSNHPKLTSSGIARRSNRWCPQHLGGEEGGGDL